MRPATNVYDYVNHVLATVPKVSVVLHDPPSTGDTGFLALSRELDGHAVELFPGTRYNEGDTLTVSVTYDGGGPRAAYARHGRGSWSREEHGTGSISSWVRCCSQPPSTSTDGSRLPGPGRRPRDHASAQLGRPAGRGGLRRFSAQLAIAAVAAGVMLLTAAIGGTQ